MSLVTISSFAKQIGISIEKLVEQLGHAGIEGKSAGDLLEDDEKITLLQFLKGDTAREPAGRQRITLKRKTTDEIRQTSKTGAARTVHVETRKKRTFVKRSILEAEQAEQQKKIDLDADRKQQELAAEQKRAQDEIKARAAAEQAVRDAEHQ
jgi:translation initiation factor IF-2